MLSTTLASARNCCRARVVQTDRGDNASSDLRDHRDLRLRRGDSLRILEDARHILDPRNASGEVLVLEQDLCGALVQRSLAERHRNRC